MDYMVTISDQRFIVNEDSHEAILKRFSDAWTRSQRLKDWHLDVYHQHLHSSDFTRYEREAVETTADPGTAYDATLKLAPTKKAIFDSKNISIMPLTEWIAAHTPKPIVFELKQEVR